MKQRNKSHQICSRNLVTLSAKLKLSTRLKFAPISQPDPLTSGDISTSYNRQNISLDINTAIRLRANAMVVQQQIQLRNLFLLYFRKAMRKSYPLLCSLRSPGQRKLTNSGFSTLIILSPHFMPISFNRGTRKLYKVE